MRCGPNGQRVIAKSIGFVIGPPTSIFSKFFCGKTCSNDPWQSLGKLPLLIPLLGIGGILYVNQSWLLYNCGNCSYSVNTRKVPFEPSLKDLCSPKLKAHQKDQQQMTRAMRDKHPFSFVLLMTTVFGGTFVTINLTCWQQLGRITHLSINSHSFLQMRVEFQTKIVAAIAYCDPYNSAPSTLYVFLQGLPFLVFF